MVATYGDATSPEAVTGRDLMRNDHLLEDLAEGINQSLKLPVDVPLIGKGMRRGQCILEPERQSMTICYEDAAEALKIYTDDGDADPRASAINSEIATFYHETGHMAIDLYQLPITGREEASPTSSPRTSCSRRETTARSTLLPSGPSRTSPGSSGVTATATERSTKASWPTPTRWTRHGCTTWNAGCTVPIRSATPIW